MAAVNLKSLSSKEIFEFINSFDTVLTDCDGKSYCIIYGLSAM